MLDLVFCVVFGSIVSSLLFFSIVSVREKELFAAKRSLLLALFIAIAIAIISFSNHPIIEYTQYTLLLIVPFAGLILFFPSRNFSSSSEVQNNVQIDERDTMFSRREICGNEKLQQDYYKRNPENIALDSVWKAKPGLMSPNSSMYNSIFFNAADASFSTIECLRPYVDGKVSSDKLGCDSGKTTKFIKEWMMRLGALEVGVCETKPYHFYSVRGRGDSYGQPVNNQHTHAIAFTVEMNKELLSTGPKAPTLMESAQQYLNSGVIAIQIAQFIRNIGYEAKAHIDGNYEVVCPLVARDAGLGELGRMGLLMSNKLGPRIRIAVITTNLPLDIDPYTHDRSVESFCSICKKCAEVCPSKAISFGDKEYINGNLRWQINQEKCFDFWCLTGTDCGRCMSVCPYSHPNNIAHNFIRWGIRNSFLFQKIALKMDHFFYGNKPKSKKFPSWLKELEKN